MFASPAFSFEVGSNLLTATLCSVGICGIYIICRDVGDLSEQCSAVPYGVDKPGAFLEGIEAKVLDEVDAIKLYHVHLGSELDFLYLFTSYNGPDITLGNADDPVRYTLPGLKHLLLLRQYLADHPFRLVVLLGKLDPDSVLIFDFTLFLNELIQ